MRAESEETNGLIEPTRERQEWPTLERAIESDKALLAIPEPDRWRELLGFEERTVPLH